MFFEDLRKTALAWAFAIFALCASIRIAVEIILPILPFVMCFVFVAVIVTAGIWYYRWRYWDEY